MMATSGFQRSWVHSQSAQNIGMAVELEDEGKLARGRIQSAFQCAPRRAGKPSRLMKPRAALPEQTLPARRNTAIFPFWRVFKIAKQVL